LVAGGAWLDYRGAALIARHYLLREAARFGLRGDAVVSGTLLDGLTVQSLRLTGEGRVREIEIERLRATWHWREILSGKIRALNGGRLRVVLDKDATSGATAATGGQGEVPASVPATDQRKASLEKLRALWATHARHVDVEWRGIEMLVRSGERELLSLDASTLSHRPGEDAVHLQLGQLRTSQGIGLDPQEVNVALTELGFSLDHLALPGGVAVRALEADVTAFKLSSEITHGDGVVDFQLDPDNLQLTLESGIIDLRAAISPWVSWPDSAGGSMETCFLGISDWKKGPSGWAAAIDAGFAELVYDRWVVPKAAVEAIWVDSAITVRSSGEAGHSPFTVVGNLWHDDLAFSKARTEMEVGSSSIGDLFATVRDRFLPDARGLPVPEGKLTAKASGSWGKGTWENLRVIARANAWTLGEKALPDVEGQFTWDSPGDPMKVELRALEDTNEQWKAEATWDMAQRSYTGKVSSGGLIDARPWMDFAGCFSALPAFVLPEFSLEWSGDGRIQTKEHAGQFTLVVPAVGAGPWPGASAKASGRYDWPRSVNNVAVELENHQDHVIGKLDYDGKVITIGSLDWRRGEETIATASAAVPWTPATRDLRAFLQLDDPIRAELKVGKRPLSFWENFLPAERRPASMLGSIAGDLFLAGSPSKPELALQLAGENLGFVSQPDLSPARLEIKLAAKDGKAEVNARAEHADIEPITIALGLPFEPSAWLEKPEVTRDLPMTGNVRMKDLRLERYAPLLPAFRQIGGRVDVDLNLGGTIASPDILGSIRLEDGIMAMKNPSIGRIEDAEVVVDFKDDRLSLSRGRARLGGGEVAITGDGLIKDGAVSCALRANGDHLLLWRDDSMIVRGSPDLTFTGDGKDWKLSGSLWVVESIFARDVDFLPIGRSFTVPTAPALPAFSAPPAPAADTKVGSLALDVLVEMKDPLLIRGNVARGQITGSARIRGTAAAPEVDGGFVLTDGVARLPLSVLRIPRAEAVFLPGRGLIPDVRATGRSKIPPYEVNVNVSGPVNNVQVHLSSEPPLPPNEVLALLATGSTTGALEDPANAQAKAAQLLVRQLRDGRLPFGRRIAALLGPLEEVQVQVGQESPFDGRARNGVTIEMTDRFLLTGAVDAEGNQRLTLTVLFRFR
jgi:hypothetical protein